MNLWGHLIYYIVIDKISLALKFQKCRKATSTCLKLKRKCQVRRVLQNEVARRKNRPSFPTSKQKQFLRSTALLLSRLQLLSTASSALFPPDEMEKESKREAEEGSEQRREKTHERACTRVNEHETRRERGERSSPRTSCVSRRFHVSWRSFIRDFFNYYEDTGTRRAFSSRVWVEWMVHSWKLEQIRCFAATMMWLLRE